MANLIGMPNNQNDGLRAAGALVETLLADTGRVRIRSWDELIRYVYGVAGTVGLMMCDVMGSRDPEALPFAMDLGIAMQLTNIAASVYGSGSAYLAQLAHPLPGTDGYPVLRAIPV